PAHPVDVRQAVGAAILVCHLATLQSLSFAFANRLLPASRQLGVLPALGLWATLCFAGAMYASWLGYGGRPFAATVTTFAWLFLVLVLFAARGVSDRLAARFGTAAGHLLAATAFFAYLIYAFGTNTFSIPRGVAAALLVFVPVALAASAEKRP